MKMIKNVFLSCILLGTLQFGISQEQEALWQVNFDKEVAWTKITDVGILLIGTSDMVLKGIDTRDGKILWENDVMKGAKGIKGPDGKKQEQSALFDQYVNVLSDDEVPEISDLIEIKYNDLMTGFKNYTVFNMRTGDVITSPEKANMPVTKFMGKQMATFNYNGTSYIPQIKAAIISGNWVDYTNKQDPDKALTKLIDLPSGEVRWESNAVAIDAYPYIDANGNLILAGTKKIAKLSGKDGSIIWEFNTSDKKQAFESFDVNLDLSAGYFFEKKKNTGQLTALDLNSGKVIWSNEMKLKVVPTMSAMNSGVILIDEKFLTLIDMQTGAEKWKAKKATGTVIDLGKGYAVAARGTRLLMLDPATGEVKWDEKVKGIEIDQIAAKGIVYSDIKGRLGIITYDGEKVWDKKGMLPVPEVRYKPELSKELMYAEGTLYEVDLVEGVYKVLKDKIDKEFKEDEVPTQIELVEGGYLLSAANNLMMLEKDGSVRWHKYWDIPEMSMAAKIALRTLQVAMAAAAGANQAAAAQSGWSSDKRYFEQQAKYLSEGADEAGAAASQKFTATKSRGDIQVVLAVIGEGGQKKGAGLVKVDRKTGEELATMILGDKEPIYDFDPISGQIFYKADKKQIISYTF